MKILDQNKDTQKSTNKSNADVANIENGSSIQLKSIMPPAFTPTANGVIQRRVEHENGDEWEGDWKKDGERGGWKLPGKPKQKWERDEENGGWKQVDKGNDKKAPLDPIKLPDRYKDEDKKEGWRAGDKAHLVDTTGTVTKYFNEEEQEKNALNPSEYGNLMDGEGQLSNLLRPQMYAMSKEGKIGAFEQALLPPNPEIEGNQRQTTHHSSLFAGDDVMHAGHIGTKDGKVDYLDDDSGHYKPDDKHTYAAYKKMKKEGIIDPSGSIKLVNKSADKMDQAAWYSNQVKLPFSAYDQTKGNEKQIRNKNSVLSEFSERYAINEGEDENYVPLPFDPQYVQPSGNPATYGQNFPEEEHQAFYEDEDSYSEVEDGEEEWFYNPETHNMECKIKGDHRDKFYSGSEDEFESYESY